MIVQIYGVMSPADGAMVAELGADQIGVVVGERGTVWDAVDFEAANGIFSAIKTGATKVALTLSNQISEIETVIRAVHFDVLHLAAGVDRLPADQVAELKRRHPGLRVIRTIPVIGPEAAFAATAFGHDWTASARIVATVQTPVILAGGLSPDNVREAIRTVRPWGVDSNTLTSRVDDRTRKDPERVRRFIETARGTV